MIELMHPNCRCDIVDKDYKPLNPVEYETTYAIWGGQFVEVPCAVRDE